MRECYAQTVTYVYEYNGKRQFELSNVSFSKTFKTEILNFKYNYDGVNFLKMTL